MYVGRVSIEHMEKTTSRKLARARLLERQQAAAAAREARERANIGDLTEYMVRAAQADEVDGWLAARTEKLKEEAERRRCAHRTAAGKALQAMRLRGESVSAIASQTGLSLARVREYLRIAATAEAAAADEATAVDARVVPLPNRVGVSSDGQTSSAAIAAAH